MWDLKKANLIETDCRMVVTGAGGVGGIGEILLKGVNMQLEDE